MNTLHNYVTEEENKLTDEERILKFKEELNTSVEFERNNNRRAVSQDTIDKLIEEYKQHLTLPREILAKDQNYGTAVSFLFTPPKLSNYHLYTASQKSESWAKGINPGQGYTKSYEIAAQKISKILDLNFVEKTITDMRLINSKDPKNKKNI